MSAISEQERDFEAQNARPQPDTVGLIGLPVISQFEVLLAPIFPQSPPAGGAAVTRAADAGRIDPRRLPHPFRLVAEAQDDGRGRTAALRTAAAASVPRPEVLQGLFILITNPTNNPATFFVVLEVNTVADAQSIANDCLAFDLRTGPPTVGAWIAPVGQTYAYYLVSNPLPPGQTTNLACIPNFLKDPAPTVSVRGVVSTRADAKQLYWTPEQRAVFYPTDGSDVFSTVAYCLTTTNGTNNFTF